MITIPESGFVFKTFLANLTASRIKLKSSSLLKKFGFTKGLSFGLSDSIDTLNPFEEKRDYFATAVLSESSNLIFDTEGRVQFPKKLLNFAKIKSDILFVGLGKTFQIWSPKNFEKFKSFARKKALQSRSTLKWDNN